MRSSTRRLLGLVRAAILAVYESANGTKQTCRAVCYWSAFGGKADIRQRFATIAVL
jgi:hypothetical protein